MRILIVSYYFPPFMNVGGFRAMSWARRFHDAGHDVTVLRGDGREAGSCAYFEENLDRDLRVLTAHNPMVGDAGAVSEPAKKAYFEPIKDILRKLMPILDGYVVWARAAFDAIIAEVATSGSFDVVISTSFPLSSHEIALRVKKTLGSVWVADFRDFYGQFDSNRIDRHSPRGFFLAKRLAEYGQAADLVSTVSEQLLHVIETWLKPRRTMVLYNGYFKEHLPVDENVEPSWSILYTGSYNVAEFTVKPLIDALSLIRGLGIEPPSIQFSGHRNDALAGEFDAAGLSAKFTGPITNREALDLQKRAGFLLLCDAMSGSGTLLTKTFEYLAAKRPIIVIARKNSDLGATLFRDKFEGYCLGEDAKAICDFIVYWRGQGMKSDREGSFFPQERIEWFSRERQADLLLEEIMNLANAKGKS